MRDLIVELGDVTTLFQRRNRRDIGFGVGAKCLRLDPLSLKHLPTENKMTQYFVFCHQ